MRLHRFYINQEIKDETTVSDKDIVNQIRKVFRLKVGDKVILFNGDDSEHLAIIDSFSDHDMSFVIDSASTPQTESSKKIILVTAIPKKDKFEWVLEKGTEVGVAGFIPVISERTEKKNVDEERSRKIIKEAAEQSGRVKLPVLAEVTYLEKFVESFGETTIVCDGSGEKNISDFKNKDELHVLIGPEGGWSDKELEFFRQKNIPIVKIGDTVLRAETAAIVAASQLLI